MYSIAVGSVTAALRGKDALSKHGIKANIKRYSGKEKIGCGYTVEVNSDRKKCVEILNSVGIKVLDVIKR